jgi:NAD(P)-dependent dehydrogenase (short-subunit alcohol dehydrogenase family)
MRQNLEPSLLAGHLATFLLKDDGVLLFTGASAPFKHATPNMLAYALAKTAVHSLVQNLSDCFTRSLPPTTCVLAILPEILDTPGNRRSLPDADFG